MIEESTYLIGTMLLCAIIFVALSIGDYIYSRKNKYYESNIGWIFVIMFAFWILIFAAALPGIDKKIIGDKHEDTQHELWIYSLFNENSYEGSFVLGSGSIEGVEYYYVFYKSTDGYRRAKYRVSDVAFVETDDRNPEIIEKVKVYTNTIVKWNKESMSEYIMYVPKGTLVKEFKIN